MGYSLSYNDDEYYGRYGSSLYEKRSPFFGASSYNSKVGLFEEAKVPVTVGVGSTVKIKDIKPGDTIKVSREVVVKSVDASEGVIYEAKTGGKVRLQQPNYSWSGRTLPQFDATLLKRQEVNPDHWPPQRGDVWEAALQEGGYSRSTYHILKDSSTGSTSAYPEDRYNYGAIEIDYLKKRQPKLVYRVGNSL